ncbi:MAG: hypothetical protein ACYDEN_12305 [Acidimicrobiales bacterium]
MPPASGAAVDRAWELTHVRRATPADVRDAEAFLDQLRALPGGRESRPGAFSFKGKALLHFHVDATGLHVDVRLGRHFERHRVETPAERERFLAAGAGAPPPAGAHSAGAPPPAGPHSAAPPPAAHP